jgi:hypothetical protein
MSGARIKSGSDGVASVNELYPFCFICKCLVRFDVPDVELYCCYS